MAAQPSEHIQFTTTDSEPPFLVGTSIYLYLHIFYLSCFSRRETSLPQVRWWPCCRPGRGKVLAQGWLWQQGGLPLTVWTVTKPRFQSVLRLHSPLHLLFWSQENWSDCSRPRTVSCSHLTLHSDLSAQVQLGRTAFPEKLPRSPDLTPT